MKKLIFLAMFLALLLPLTAAGGDLFSNTLDHSSLDHSPFDHSPVLHHQTHYHGQLSSNPFTPHSTANPFTGGNPYGDTIANPYSEVGRALQNPYIGGGAMLFTTDGEYRGNLNSNPFDPNSVSNPFGEYGSPFSPESINNPFGAGSPFNPDSPTNPFGHGLMIISE